MLKKISFASILSIFIDSFHFIEVTFHRFSFILLNLKTLGSKFPHPQIKYIKELSLRYDVLNIIGLLKCSANIKQQGIEITLDVDLQQ